MDDEQDDVRSYLPEWTQARAAESWKFEPALNRLVAAGCDRLRISWLLLTLANAQGWSNIRREDVGRIVNELRKAAAGLRQLFFSQLNQTLQLDSRQFEGKLMEIADRAEKLMPKVHERRPMRRDLARATLVHYVLTATGEYHDPEVAALISVVEAVPFMDGPANQEAENYTRDAHVQWRNRDSCKAFLNGPSHEVLAMLATMNADLDG